MPPCGPAAAGGPIPAPPGAQGCMARTMWPFTPASRRLSTIRAASCGASPIAGRGWRSASALVSCRRRRRVDIRSQTLPCSAGAGGGGDIAVSGRIEVLRPWALPSAVMKLVVEPSGAVSTAPPFSPALRLSGPLRSVCSARAGNVDPIILARPLSRQATANGRPKGRPCIASAEDRI